MAEEANITPEKLHERAETLYEKKLSPEAGRERELSEAQKRVREEIIEAGKGLLPLQTTDEASKAASELLTLDDRAQLSELIKLAFTKGVIFSLNVGRKLQNPLVLDTFHDLLASDDLYYRFIKEKRM